MPWNRTLALFIVACLGSMGLAYGNWTATGSFRYVDREFDQGGFTGVQPAVPIRFATVEVRDGAAKGGSALLATGATDASGNFSITVPDNKTRTVYVRALTASTAVTGLYLKVQNRVTPRNPYAVASAMVTGHAPAANVNFGVLTAAVGAGGEAFNLYDAGLRAVDFIAALNGARPGSSFLLTLEWQAGAGGPTSSYDPSSRTVSVGDISGYNDTVVLHECGHYAFSLYSASDSPGGAHHLLDCAQDVRLAYDEGRATWFGQSVRRHHNLPRPELYVKTTGAPGAGNLDFYFDVENEVPYECDGASSEVAVYSALWDINDTAATADATPGLDDDTLARPATDNWDVDRNYVRTAVNKSLEDFWDGWFTRGKGSAAGMIAAFQRTNVEFYPDPGEPNDGAATALPVAAGGTSHRTFFADLDGNGVGGPDVDVFTFGAIAGTVYTIETLNLWGRADTSIELLAADGVTVLAANDNRAAGDDSSLVIFTATTTGPLYIRSFHAPGPGVYGSYDLRITTAP